MHKMFKIPKPEQGWPTHIPPELKPVLRPIAETLAMLDGNAFFGTQLGDGREWYEQYLPEALVLFESNGGLTGWASEASFVKECNHENAEVAQAYENWITMKRLYQNHA